MFGLSTVAVRWVLGVILVILILGGVYAKGRHDVQVNFDAYKAEVKAVAAAQEEKTKQIEAKNKRLFEEAQNAYNTKLATLRSYYSMRGTSNGSGGVPKISTPTTGVAGATTYELPTLPPVETLAAQCAEATLTLVSLQEWVKNVAYNME